MPPSYITSRLHVVVDSDSRSFTGPPMKSGRSISQGKAISDGSDGNTLSHPFKRVQSTASVNAVVKATSELIIRNGDDGLGDLGHDDVLEEKVDKDNTTTVETELLRGVNSSALIEEEEKADGGEGEHGGGVPSIYQRCS